MQQVKIFMGVDEQRDDLERDINAWLKSSGAKVVQVFGNVAPQSMLRAPESTRLLGAESGVPRRYGPSDLMIVVVYEA